MSGLTDQEKLKFILENAVKYDITPYEFGTNTSISVFAARSVLKGNTKKPAGKTIDAMYQYIKKKMSDSTPATDATEGLTDDEKVARKIEQRLQPMLDKIAQDLNFLIMRERVYRMDITAMEENLQDLRDTLVNKK